MSALRSQAVDATHPVEPAQAWSLGFRVLYRVLGWLEPLIRSWWLGYGLGNVVQVTIPGRRTGRTRTTLLGVLQANDTLYLGHPNGPSQWTRNLDAADGRLLMTWTGQAPVAFQAELLPPGPERDRAIRATWQHPFPGDLIYRLGRRHIQAVGRYYRLELDIAE